MTKLTGKVDYLVLGDIHLFHNRVKTKEIIANLDAYFDNYRDNSQFCNLNAIFIDGDLFDNLEDFASENVLEVHLWAHRLFGFCERHNIILRVLEGTPSHDWRQSKFMTVVHSTRFNSTVDFKYISTLYVETMTLQNQDELKILYVPDEWSPSAEETFRQVKTLMQQNNVDQFDIAIMHGMFSYQIRHIENPQKHSEADYLSIVKYFINIGHIHTHYVYGRIIPPGSFDRLSHGEEEPKGAVRCVINDKGENYFNFIENKNAKIFKTIKVKFLDIDRALLQIERALVGIKVDSYIRIKADPSHPIYAAFDQVKLKFPEYNMSKIADADISEDEEKVYQLPLATDHYKPISITRENLTELLINEISAKYDFNEQKINFIASMIEESL